MAGETKTRKVEFTTLELRALRVAVMDCMKDNEEGLRVSQDLLRQLLYVLEHELAVAGQPIN